MPERAYRECCYPLCRAVAVRRGYCSQHAPTTARTPMFVRNDPRLSNLTPANKRFRRARHSFLIRHPLCAMCGEAATVLDHITPHRGVPALFWSERNWQPLCFRCHGVKTAREVLHA